MTVQPEAVPPRIGPAMWLPPPGSPAARAIAHVAAHSTGPALDASLHVTLNFHPDRLHRGAPLLRVLADEGIYRSQFETGTSNGGLTAHPGGDRWQWESRIFGGAYDGAPPQQRPKYGALNFRRHPAGASPRFGSAHLRLRRAVLARTTFCYPDSVFAPNAFGVAAHMSLIALAEAHRGDPLDGYIEAHLHGPLELARDVEALVLDPCFRGTAIEQLACALPCPVQWHAGFRVHVDTLAANADYRGARFVELGRELARDGWLTPDRIGEAARDGRYDSQDLKKVWHCLACFGYCPGDDAVKPSAR